MTNEDINFDLIMDEDLAVNQYPKSILKQRASGKCSLASKTVSPDLWNKLKDKKTKNGWTLARAINTSAMNPTSFVGCHAGDLESY